MKRLLTLLFLVLAVPCFAQELSLSECLDMCSESRSSRKAELAVLQAEAQKAEARLEYLPRVSVTALAYQSVNPLLDISLRDVLGNSDAANDLNTQLTAYAYENGMKPYFTMFQKGYGTSVSLLQPLYAGGRIVNGNRLASLGVEASRLQGSLALKAVRDSVENKYWRIVSLQQKQKILLETAGLLDALDKDLSTAVRAGLALEADLLELRLKRSELKAGLTKLTGGLSLLKMDLLDEIGYEYSYLELPSLVLSDTPGELPEPSSVFADGFDLASVPQARLLEMQEKAAALEKKMAVGELLPQVAVGAAFSYSALSLPRDATSNGLVFAMVQVPITDLGKAAYRSKRLGYKVQDAQEEREYLLKKLSLLENKLRLDVDTSWEQIAVCEETVGNAEARLDRMRLMYTAGEATATELMRCALEVSTARESLVSSQISYRLAVSAYRSLAGE